jgi:hypothetical protein
MKLTKYSTSRFYQSFAHWDVQREFAEPIFNYFVYGYSPGSFFTALLANDAVGALCRSHPANTVEALKALCNWLENSRLRGVAWGDYDTVDRWLRMDERMRRAVLEHAELIYSEDKEIWMTLQGVETNEPILY